MPVIKEMIIALKTVYSWSKNVHKKAWPLNLFYPLDNIQVKIVPTAVHNWPNSILTTNSTRKLRKYQLTSVKGRFIMETTAGVSHITNSTKEGERMKTLQSF